MMRACGCPTKPFTEACSIQARGALKKELLDHLRSKRRIRRSQHSCIFKDERGQIPEAISIRERHAEVEDRAIQGHWGAISRAAQETVTSRAWWNAIRALSC